MATSFAGDLFITDAAGAPVPGALIHTYEAGTTTPKAAYTTSALSTPESNPIVAGANGRAQFFLGTGTYRIKVFYPAALGGAELTEYEQDNISAEGADALADLASTASAALGDALVGVKLVATGAVARTQHDKNADAISAKDFGAVCDNSTDDTAAINAATTWAAANGVGIVDVPGLSKTTGPIYLDSGVRLRFKGRSGGLRKTTNTAGTGSNTARAGTVVDTYAVDAIVIIRHTSAVAGTDYAYDCGLIGGTLTGAGPSASDGALGCDYGVYAPRTSGLLLDGTEVVTCVTGVGTHDSWRGKVVGCTATAVSYGVRHMDDGSALGTGTSMLYDLWCNFDNTRRNPITAFDLYGLTYSTLTNCANDNLSNTSAATEVYGYTFSTCVGVTMIGCGMESARAGVISAINSRVNVFGMRTFAMTGSASWSAVGGIFNDASTMVFSACDFAAYTSPGTLFNRVLQGGGVQTEIDSSMPSGGDAFVGYGGGSALTIVSAGQATVVKDSYSVGLLPLIGSATYDPGNILDGAGVTTTVAVTGAALGDFAVAAFSLDLQGITLSAWVSATDTVSVRLQNESGGALDLASGTLRVRVFGQ